MAYSNKYLCHVKGTFLPGFFLNDLSLYKSIEFKIDTGRQKLKTTASLNCEALLCAVFMS